METYFNKFDSLKESLLKYLIKIPGSRNLALSKPNRTKFELAGNDCKSIEIVSHCWNYHHLLAYQLQSVALQKLDNLKVVFTVFYSEEDQETKMLLDKYSNIDVEGVQWNWLALDKTKLFRRSIGRNIAAESTQADWIWFTDCDVIFGENCLNNLQSCLSGVNEALVFPNVEYRSKPLEANDTIFNEPTPSLKDIDLSSFNATQINRATGPLQIVHGDAARKFGYCKQFNFYQKPALSWCKATEDRVFRWILNHEGHPLPISPVLRIQHVEKGRYQKNSMASVRKFFQTFKS